MASVDVDGDGRRDQVGLVAHKIASGGTLTVRVRTATGARLQTTGRDVFWYAKPYFGAAAIDGRRGAELVVGDTMGAHYEQFRVVTYRDGKLVTLRRPPLVWTARGLQASTPRWGVDGSYSFNVGVFRSVSAKHAVTLTLKSSERRLSGRGHTGHVTSYRWRNGGWVKVSARKVRLIDRQAFASGGWHVAGLRRFV